MKNCPICKRPYRYRSHFSEVHGITDLTNLDHDCACGCGLKIPFFKKHRPSEINEFHIGHNNRVYGQGSEAVCWRGGRRFIQGYVYIYSPDHHLATISKAVAEHRIIWEKHHNACLLPWGEIVHHNRKNDDNRIENLIAMTISQRISLQNKKDMTNRICFKCGSTTTYIDPKGYAHWAKLKEDKTKFLCHTCHWKLYGYFDRLRRQRSKPLELLRKIATDPFKIEGW